MTEAEVAIAAAAEQVAAAETVKAEAVADVADAQAADALSSATVTTVAAAESISALATATAAQAQQQAAEIIQDKTGDIEWLKIHAAQVENSLKETREQGVAFQESTSRALGTLMMGLQELTESTRQKSMLVQEREQQISPPQVSKKEDADVQAAEEKSRTKKTRRFI